MTKIARHTEEEVRRAARAAEAFDPDRADVRDLGQLRAVADAADAVNAANERLRDSIAVARLYGGYSWNRIADTLGVSRQAARQRYAEWVEAKQSDPEFRERIRRLVPDEPSAAHHAASERLNMEP